jgi:DNA-binding transcriptional LysR family regulator
MGTKQEQIFSSKTLTYFLQLSDTMSYTQAAQLLGITQPALTQQIKKLEHAIGAPLFYTVGKKLRLTDAGYTMLSASHEINRVLNDATDEIQQTTGADRGEINIGVLASIETRVFEAFIAEFYRQEPGVKVTFRMLNRNELWENLESNEIDVAIMYIPDESIKKWRSYRARRIVNENLLFIHHDAKLAQKDRVRFQRTTHFDWVTYPKGFYLDTMIREAYKNSLVGYPNVVACFTTPEQLINFANDAGVATVLPESFVATRERKENEYINRFDPAISFDLSFVFKRDKDTIPRLTHFMNNFDTYLNEKSYGERLNELTKKDRGEN